MQTAAARRDFTAEEKRRTLAAVMAQQDGPAPLQGGPKISVTIAAEWISWRGVSRLTMKGRRWIYRRAAEGAWGAKREGNRWRFQRTLVEAWVIECGWLRANRDARRGCES
jgi:hypothetical protein